MKIVLPAIFIMLDHFISDKNIGFSFGLVILFSLILATNINLSHPFFQRGILGIFVSTHFLAVLGLWMVNLFTVYYLPGKADAVSH